MAEISAKSLSSIHDGFGDLCVIPRPFVNYDCHHWDDEEEPDTIWGWEDDGGKAMTSLFGEVYCDHEEADVAALTIVFSPPLLELPKEVRDLIFRYCVAPFRNEKEGDIIVVKLAPEVNNVHPLRKHYDIFVPLAVPHICDSRNGIRGRHLDPEDYHTLRALSNVSRSIRYEINSAFWNRISMILTAGWLPLRAFIEDRPMATKGIKILTLSLDHRNFNVCAAFNVAISLLAEHTNLERLHFDLATTPSQARRLVATSGGEEWVASFRTIKTQVLIFRLYLQGPDNSDHGEYAAPGGSSHANPDQPTLEYIAHQQNNGVEGSHIEAFTANSSEGSVSLAENIRAAVEEHGEESSDHDPPKTNEAVELTSLDIDADNESLEDEDFDDGYESDEDPFGMGFDDFGGYSDAGYEYDDTSISQESLSGWYGVANVELANVLRPQIEALLRPPQSNLVTAETEYLKSRAAELAKDELEDD